jgi:hypothetical protein
MLDECSPLPLGSVPCGRSVALGAKPARLGFFRARQRRHRANFPRGSSNLSGVIQKVGLSGVGRAQFASNAAFSGKSSAGVQ